jgi:hypothetical protein
MYAAGGLSFDYPGFVHTVLVDMRARLAASQFPDRIFEVTLAVAKSAGPAGRKRVQDPTPLYDALSTIDTVALLHSGIRGLLRVADKELEAGLRVVLDRFENYANAGKHASAWDDAEARRELVDVDEYRATGPASALPQAVTTCPARKRGASAGAAALGRVRLTGASIRSDFPQGLPLVHRHVVGLVGLNLVLGIRLAAPMPMSLVFDVLGVDLSDRPPDAPDLGIPAHVVPHAEFRTHAFSPSGCCEAGRCPGRSRG